jgi:hypothetical protein
MDAAEGAYSGPTNPGAAYGEARVAYWIHVAEVSEIYALQAMVYTKFVETE